MLVSRSSQILGALVGQAVGDALGLFTEYHSSAQAADEVPETLVHRATERTFNGKKQRFEAGEWSDDTDQALILLDSYLDKGCVEPADVAARLHHWFVTSGKGAGSHTTKVLNHPAFLEDPEFAAIEVGRMEPPECTPNGAVMRTSVVGLFQPFDRADTTWNALLLAGVTHAAPRCRASAVLISRMVAELVEGSNPARALSRAEEDARRFDPEIRRFTTRRLAELRLDQGLPRASGVPVRIGDTYQAMGAGCWALDALDRNVDPLHASAVEIQSAVNATMREIYRAGGDTDTNGAIAGALIGAWCGVEAFPPAWVSGLKGLDTLIARAERLKSSKHGC